MSIVSRLRTERILDEQKRAREQERRAEFHLPKPSELGNPRILLRDMTREVEEQNRNLDEAMARIMQLKEKNLRLLMALEDALKQVA